MCTGTKSEAEARIASRKYAKILQKLSYAVSFKVGGALSGRARLFANSVPLLAGDQKKLDVVKESIIGACRLIVSAHGQPGVCVCVKSCMLQGAD